MGRFSSGHPEGVAVQELETLVRMAVFKPANALVGYLLQQAADRIDATYQSKPGQVCKGRATILVQGIFGFFPLCRDYYYHAGKKQGHYPADAALGLEGTLTPALSRLVCLEGSDETSFLKAQDHLSQTGGIEISARQIQRVVQRVGKGAVAWQERQSPPATAQAPILYISGDGTGVPMRPEELQGRAGKQADGCAKTRQVYLGCVFTQHCVDEEGHPLRDWQSTTYVSSLSGIGEFGPLLRQEARRRGLGNAKQTVLLIDGATGLENMGKDCFKDSVQIVDFFHAMEHATHVLEALLGTKEHPEYKQRHRHWTRRLLKDGVQSLIEKTRQEALTLRRSNLVEAQLGYFVKNVKRMQYGTFRKMGFFIGSGVVEAGCKSIVGTRCKQSGMRWGKPGAQNILALRCIHASRYSDAFWKDRLNHRAAANDSLALAA